MHFTICNEASYIHTILGRKIEELRGSEEERKGRKERGNVKREDRRTEWDRMEIVREERGRPPNESGVV